MAHEPLLAAVEPDCLAAAPLDEQVDARTSDVSVDASTPVAPAGEEVASLSMWPWDHLAVGYVTYSLLRRATGRHPPTAAAVAFVLLGSQLPDLIDKPLGWYVGVLPSGTSLAHSLVFAVPVCLLVLAWRARRDAPDQGVAFSVAYLLHLPADAYYPTLLGFEARPWILLWPIVAGEHTAPADVTNHVADLIALFAEALAGPAGVYLLAIELGLVGSAGLLWYLDGLPGAPLGQSRAVRDRTKGDH